MASRESEPTESISESRDFGSKDLPVDAGASGNGEKNAVTTTVLSTSPKIPASVNDLDGPTMHSTPSPDPARTTTVKFESPVAQDLDDELFDALTSAPASMLHSAARPADDEVEPTMASEDAIDALPSLFPPDLPSGSPAGVANEVTRPLRIAPMDDDFGDEDFGDGDSDEGPRDADANDDATQAGTRTPAPLSLDGASLDGVARGPKSDEASATPLTTPSRIKSASFETPELDTSDFSAADLLDELGPLSEKTVDIDLPLLTKEMEGGSPSTEEGRTLEGAPQLEDAGGILPPPAPGTVVKSLEGEDITLTVSLGDQRGSVFFRATIEGDPSPYTAVWTPNPRPEPPWTTLPDPRVVRPRAVARLENAAIRVFERPKGNTVVDYLLDPDRFLPAMATLELGLELAEMLESLHGAGLFLYDLDPSQIVIEKSGRVRLYPISGFYRAQDLPRVSAGTFAAPEVRRGLRYRVGAHSDVFAVALVLYALLARRSPLEEDLDPAKLVNPRTFRPECPLGIWPHLQSCLDPSPSSRVGHARGLRKLLEKARDRLLEEARAADEPAPVVLEAWAEVHTGLAKARRGAPQQDRAIGVTDEEGTVGLYLIADGVSRSKFGDGAFAAEQVKQASYQRWTALEKAGPAALALSHAQRQDVLRQISRSAGKKVAAEVNAHWAPIPNEPNQVMSSTLVAAFVVAGEATIANLGDSRAYLVRKGEIEQISIDHDRTTDGLRMGLSFKEAGEMRMGSALTRVVGRVVIDDEGSCRPDPFEPEVFRLRLLPGDRLVLCSDGVADFAAGPGAPTILAEHAMRDVVEEYEDPVRAAFELVVLANRAGGYDNISCVVIAAHPG